jgi:outer membrane protein
MNTRSFALVGTLVSFVAGSAAAQQRGLPSVPQSLSLEEAIGLARGYSPTYLQTLNDRSPAAWGTRNAFASFLPSFNVFGQLSYTGTGSQAFLSTQFETSPTISSFYQLSLNWTFDGSTLMQPGVQRAALTAADASIDAAGMALRSNIVQQYLLVLQAQAQVEIQERQVARNEENLRLAQARFQVGQVTMIDVRQAEVAKGQSDVALLQAGQSVTVERLRLFQQMGVLAPEDPSVVVLSDTFPIVEPTWRLGDLLATADAENPDVNSLRAQESSARRNERVVKSQWLPSLNFSAAWAGFTQEFTNQDLLVTQEQQRADGQVTSCETNNVIFGSAGLPASDCTELAFTPATEAAVLARNSVFPFSFTKQPFRATVSVNFPIFDQFNRNVQVSQASARTDDALELRRARELQVRTDVSQQYYGLLAAHETIGIQENNRVAAQEQLRLARERYRVGSGTFFELLDAQLVAQQAEADYVNSVYDYHRSLATLEAAVGQPLR